MFEKSEKKKILAVNPHILCPDTNFREKMTFFVTCVKNTNFCDPKWLLTRRVHFCTAQKKNLFPTKFCV
jgi:hypothetical protein